MIPNEDLHLLETPCYVYDTALLRRTIEEALAARPSDQYRIHYAVKANARPEILRVIAGYGLGADCVSLGEMRLAIDCGFPPSKIVLAGVGKSDDEIGFALVYDIECLNVESIEELQNIACIAEHYHKPARVALRINPNIDAHTHKYITTGLKENKFGIDRRLAEKAVQLCLDSPWLRLVGIHCHIGSQILTPAPFVLLAKRMNKMVARFTKMGANITKINVGGGLGVDYDNPDANPVADFRGFFDALRDNLTLRPDQECVCELGRSLVAQCGWLLSRVRYVKEGVGRRFIILDAGMNDLIRPALYQAHHAIQNLTNPSGEPEVYDVVGPICESDDTFARDESLPRTSRGDLMAIRTAGAYGETMASTYNCRPLAPAVML